MFQGDEKDPNATISVANMFKTGAFAFIHLACFLAIWTGVSPIALAVCFALYVIRMFGITGVYHRYFSHRTYQTSRVFQFVLAWIGAMSAQKGPIWWASHHRHHHKHSDTPQDVHSPIINGIFYAHVGWIMSSEFIHTKWDLVKDLTKFPEIKWLDQYHLLPPFLLGLGTYLFGLYLEVYHPSFGTTGWQMLVVGFFISTTLLYHGTFCINSFTHLIGNRRFNTTDESRNNWFLALITLGEGWHNNHHRYPGSEPQGMYWWEFDISHYTIKVLSWLGLVWDIRTHPKRIYQEAEGNI